MSIHESVAAPTPGDAASQETCLEGLRRLSSLAHELLPRTADSDDALLAHKTFVDGEGYRNLGSNPLYTAMSVVGAVADGTLADRMATPGRLDALYAAAAESREASLLGAAAWAFASVGDRRAAKLVVRGGALDVRRLPTMGLGLLLAGAAATAEDPAAAGVSLRASMPAFAELERRFSAPASLLRATPGGVSRQSLLYREVTSFASQVYPLLGVARFVQRFDVPLPPWLGSVAGRLVETQGRMGQWWWLYSARDGRVLEGYPVYSVHQDAMAFLALLPLQQIGVGAYEGALARGLEWMFGSNELSVHILDDEPLFLARAVQRRGGDADALWGLARRDRVRLALAARRLAPAHGPSICRSSFEVLQECRSYHLGWILLAYSLALEVLG